MSWPQTSHRIGRVVDVDAERCRVRVAFDEADGLVSWWLPVLQPKTGRDKVYWLPDLDEHVCCLIDAHCDAGVVLGAIFSAADEPPISSTERRHVQFSDGTTIDYDRQAHRLAIDLPASGADVVITTQRKIVVTAQTGDIELHVSEGQNVYLGDTAGSLRLATEKFVETIYETHVHPTPAGISGVPILKGTELQWPNVSTRSKTR